VRRRLYEILEQSHGEDRTSQWVDAGIVTLILLNVAAFIAESVPSIRASHGTLLTAFEALSVMVFSAEYVLRSWVSVEIPFLKRYSPAEARLRFARRPAQVIDLLAILPFYLSYLFALDLRVLRSLRLLRFFKLSRYSPAIHTLVRVMANERRALMGAGLLLAGAVLFAATGAYYLEQDAQPEKFGTVPDAAWWAITTLTTVGYGDVTPVTPLGKVFGGLVMITGLCILALPVAIIATGFAQEVSRRDFVVNWSLMSRIPLLAELEASEVAMLMPLLHAHNLPPNIEVIAEGSEGLAMFFVASGKVERRSKDTAQSFAAGDVFGAVAMLDNDLHDATFVTATRSRLLKLHREDFHRLEIAKPSVTAHIRRVAVEQRIIAAKMGGAAEAAASDTASASS
jgi:voltage-gated potassium channel